jgi:sugar/nucleoside kinase (ribokinase family)
VSPRVACVGVYIVDVLGRPVDELPRGQDSRLLDEIRITVAGTAGGTGVDLARLGADVIAIGAIGEDNLADFMLSVLEREGVAVEHLARKPGVQTSATILPIHPNGDRPAWHVLGANATLEAGDIPWGELPACDALHLGGLAALGALDGEPAARVARVARESGVLVTADCLGVKREDALEVVTPVLPYVDIFMPNEQEATALTEEPDASAAARQLRMLGAACVIVKRGEHGCLVVDDDGERELPAFASPVVDTTGCGDAFSAGFLRGLALGRSRRDAAALGCAAAALVAQGLGTDHGDFGLADADALAAGPVR